MTTTIEAAPQGEEQQQKTHREILIVFAGLMLGMLLAALDQTIVSTALPTIVGELGGVEHLSWVITAYLLTSTASTPLYGKLSDQYGRKIFFQIAIVLFLLGSVLAGISQNMLQLILFRGLQGIGGGGIMSMAMVIIGDLVSPRERGRYQGFMGSVFAFASVTGPLIGGLFTDELSWRWVFYINMPLGALALFVTVRYLHLPYQRLQHAIDYLGAALMVGGVTCLLLVTTWGGTQYAWDSPTIVLLAAAACVLLTAFVFQELRAPEPILPMRFFKRRSFTIANAVSFLVALSMFGAISFMPLYLQIVRGVSATSSGLRLTPMMAGLLISSIGSGQVISRTGRYRVFPIAGTAVMSFGLFLLSTLDVDTPMLQVSLYMLVLGFGIGMVMQVVILAVQNDSARSELGVATSAVSFFRSMGGAVGVAIFGSLLANRLDYYLPRLVPPENLQGLDTGRLRGSPEVIGELPALVHSGVVQAFADSIHVVFMAALPIALVAFALCWLLREIPLRDDRPGKGANGEDERSPVMDV